jgi:hypothetical protein
MVGAGTSLCVGDQLRYSSSDVLRSVRASSCGGTVTRDHSRYETGGLHIHIHPSTRLPFHLHKIEDVNGPILSCLNSDVTCVRGKFVSVR